MLILLHYDMIYVVKRIDCERAVSSFLFPMRTSINGIDGRMRKTVFVKSIFEYLHLIFVCNGIQRHHYGGL